MKRFIFVCSNVVIYAVTLFEQRLIEAGCDEAGRGCLAGAVYAAAVILPKDFKNELLNDSKQLTEKQRYALREVIEKEALRGRWELSLRRKLIR